MLPLLLLRFAGVRRIHGWLCSPRWLMVCTLSPILAQLGRTPSLMPLLSLSTPQIENQKLSYRVAKNLFSEIKNQNQKPINAKICFFSLIGHVGTRAIFSKSTAADKKSWKGTWEVKSRTPVECMLCCTFAQARRCNACSSCHKGPAGP